MIKVIILIMIVLSVIVINDQKKQLKTTLNYCNNQLIEVNKHREKCEEILFKEECIE